MDNINKLLLTKRLIKLLKDFSMKENITAVEFLDQKTSEKETLSNLQEITYEHFLILTKHYDFFNIMVNTYFIYYGLKPLNKYTIIILMYIVIFMLNESNSKDVLDVFAEMKYQFCWEILNYFTIEECIVDITQAGCKIFDNEHVLNYIVHPILSKALIIENIKLELEQIIRERTIVVPKPVTKPISPKCTQHPIYNLIVPPNSFANMHFKSQKLSKAVMKGDTKIKKCLEKSYTDNKKRALKLLEFARENAYECTKSVPKIICDAIQPKFQFKSIKLPPNKEVSIKPNAASLMREAATMVKDKESEIKRIKALTQSFFDPTKYSVLEEEMRKCKEQEYLQDIERKHLQGLLTHEESILAKQNLLKINKEKMEEFKIEREKILEEIEIWKQEEQAKIKILVERCQGIEKAAREAEQKLHQDKKNQARLMEYETKLLLKEAYEEQQKELARKVKLIQELRALEQVRSIAVKEFDPTESPNFGLLCEMSIAELQERLRLLKIALEDELATRRENVLENRQKQQQLIENVKQFIEDNKATKMKPAQKVAIELQQTPDLTALRERLQKARQERMTMQYSETSSSKSCCYATCSEINCTAKKLV